MFEIRDFLDMRETVLLQFIRLLQLQVTVEFVRCGVNSGISAAGKKIQKKKTFANAFAYFNL